ncbi:SKOR [Symbiodinium sp. KB8]|nr:SKOR [Symbiodinium sp. KB8]
MDKFAEAAELCAAASDPQFLTSLLKFRSLLAARASATACSADANAGTGKRSICGDYDRRTPLHLACASGNHAAVEVLIQEDSINMSCRDNFGRTPLMEAVRHGNENCARLLQTRGAHHGFCEDGNTDDSNVTHAGQELCQAAFSGQNSYLNNLISLCGLSPDCCDYDKRTALMLACAEGNMEAAVSLVQIKADPYLTDRWGHSAITEAKENRHYDLVAVLEKLHKSQKLRAEHPDSMENAIFRAGFLGSVCLSHHPAVLLREEAKKRKEARTDLQTEKAKLVQCLDSEPVLSVHPYRPLTHIPAVTEGVYRLDLTARCDAKSAFSRPARKAYEREAAARSGTALPEAKTRGADTPLDPRSALSAEPQISVW